MLLLSPFHSVCLTSVSPLFHHLVFHTARHIEAIDVHWCLSCRHGFVMRSPGSRLGGSRISAPRLFCLAPPGHLVKFWPCAVVSFDLVCGRRNSKRMETVFGTNLTLKHRDVPHTWLKVKPCEPVKS